MLEKRFDTSGVGATAPSPQSARARHAEQEEEVRFRGRLHAVPARARGPTRRWLAGRIRPGHPALRRRRRIRARVLLRCAAVRVRSLARLDRAGRARAVRGGHARDPGRQDARRRGYRRPRPRAHVAAAHDAREPRSRGLGRARRVRGPRGGGRRRGTARGTARDPRDPTRRVHPGNPRVGDAAGGAGARRPLHRGSTARARGAHPGAARQKRNAGLRIRAGRNVPRRIRRGRRGGDR